MASLSTNEEQYKLRKFSAGRHFLLDLLNECLPFRIAEEYTKKELIKRGCQHFKEEYSAQFQRSECQKKW